MSRTHAREVAFQLLCALDLHKGYTPKQAFIHDEELTALGPEDREFAESLVKKVFKARKKLDDAYAGFLRDWTVDRLATVDRNLLRIAVFEIQEQMTPVPVAINEAIELAKTYGTEDSPRLIHGILGSLLRSAPSTP